MMRNAHSSTEAQMQTQSRTPISAPPENNNDVVKVEPRAPNIRRLPRAAALTAVAAVLADLAFYATAGQVWGVPNGFAMLNPIAIVVTVLGGVLLAAIGLAVLARLTPRAVAIFVALAIVVTAVSLIGPLQAMAGAMPGTPPATTATGMSMIVMHLVTGGIIAGLLPALARH
jgi:Family of unknown function (DUF6069)